jgi:YesN/AraC family two-component response regulator
MKKILLIDDQIEVLETIAGIISDANFQCAIMMATNGADGLAKFQHFQPDVVITDTEMPEMSGVEVIRAIKAENLSTKIILKSARLENKKLADQEGVPFYCFQDFESILELI